MRFMQSCLKKSSSSIRSLNRRRLELLDTVNPSISRYQENIAFLNPRMSCLGAAEDAVTDVETFESAFFSAKVSSNSVSCRNCVTLSRETFPMEEYALKIRNDKHAKKPYHELLWKSGRKHFEVAI